MDASAAFLPPPPSPSSTTPCLPFQQSNPPLQLDGFGPGDAFPVDNLLDFPFDDDVSSPPLETGSSQESVELSVCEGEALVLSGWNEKIGLRAVAVESVEGREIGQPPASELCVPPDELADQLEWLAALVEDSPYFADTTLAPLVSYGDLSGCMLESTSDALSPREPFQSPSPVSVLEQTGSAFSGRPWCLSLSFAVPARARSKRSRTGGRVWSLDTLIPVSVDSKAFIDCSGESYLSYPELEGEVPFARPSKKSKKASACSKSVDIPQPRKCAHCLVQKTPQWRAGPKGPKTLCNACGVRFKSGRLVPEYRPAGSPTFVTEVHSNSHKRILEMRKLKEFEAWEVRKPSGLESDCRLAAEDKALDAKPRASATTLAELLLQTHEGAEDDCHSQNGSYEEDDAEDKERQEESSSDTG